MMSKWLLSPLLLCAELMPTLMASEDCCSSYTEQWENESENRVEGIFLTERPDYVIPDGRPEVFGIQMMDIDLPGCEESLRETLRCFLGRPLTREVAIEIKQAIIEYYIQCGVTMIGVEVPSQMSEGGVIQFLVIRKRVGQIYFCGESFYNSDYLYYYLGVTPGEEIEDCVLQSNLAWLNKNPFSYSKFKFLPTDDREVLDIEVTARRRRALRFYVKGDNTGSARTGYGRLYTGFAWGNAFNVGDILSFEYETSNEFKRLQAWTVAYTSFLPWQHIFNIYGEYAVVKPSPPKPLPTFLRAQNITARAWQIKSRYTIPFWPYHTCLQQNVSFGFEVKNTNSSIINFAGSTVEVQPPTRFRMRSQIYVTQLVGAYTRYDTCGCHDYTFIATFYLSPFKFLPHQTTADYERLRYRSKPKYCYLEVTAGDVWRFWSEMSVSVLLRGQVSNATLPPTELMTIGGYDTVRGYHQAEAAGDNGFIANLELRTREYCIFPCSQGKLTFLAFLDYGVSNNWKIRPSNILGVKNFPKTQWLLGVGPGLRYTINPYFQLRCDYGFKLHKLESNTPFLRQLHAGSGELHIGALATF